jgi:hypothetical protein
MVLPTSFAMFVTFIIPLNYTSINSMVKRLLDGHFFVGINSSYWNIWPTCIYDFSMLIILEARIHRTFCHAFRITVKTIHKPTIYCPIYANWWKEDGIGGPCNRSDNSQMTLQSIARHLDMTFELIKIKCCMDNNEHKFFFWKVILPLGSPPLPPISISNFVICKVIILFNQGEIYYHNI